MFTSQPIRAGDNKYPSPLVKKARCWQVFVGLLSNVKAASDTETLNIRFRLKTPDFPFKRTVFLSQMQHTSKVLLFSLKLRFDPVSHVSTLDLSSELVGRLQVRDQLRTEQDAMLLEVQDLTSL